MLRRMANSSESSSRPQRRPLRLFSHRLPLGSERVRLDVSDRAVASGLSNSMAGSHTSKTMMLRELRALLAAVPSDSSYDVYADAVLQQNALGKATSATRSKTLLHLRHLYALDGSVAVFAALRDLWSRDDEAQPTLALLCACARDPLLRATAGYILEAPIGELVTPEILGREVAHAYPSRYKEGTLHHIGQNTGSSWNQAGFLDGRVRKYRVRPRPTEMALVFALYLGHLEGLSGPALTATLWVRLLEADEYWIEDNLINTGRAGWIDLARSGGMTEIGFEHLDGLTGASR